MVDMFGRLEAQSVLRTRLKLCRDGRSGIVLIDGESGLGKSRLIAEERRYAELLGLHVLWGRADEQRSNRPFFALRSLLESSFRAEQDPSLRKLCAELDQQLRTLPAPSTLKRPPAHVGRSVTTVLEAWARRSPVALFVDDLQAADRDSCDLLGAIPRQLDGLPLVVVATLREPLPAHVADLVNLWERQLGRELTRVTLAPLDRHDALCLARELGPELTREALTDLLTQARGNPFNLQQAIAARRAESPDNAQVPDADAAALLLRQLTQLHPDALAVGEVVATLERPRPALVPLVAAAADLSDEVVASAMDSLTRGGVLLLEDGSFRFALPAARRALLESSGPARNYQLHGVIADRLQALRAAGEPIDLVELAPHLAAAARPGDESAIEVLTEVATRFANHAPQSAADWYRQALALMPQDDLRRRHVLVERARVLYLAARLEEAVTDGLQALDQVEDPAVVARTGTVVTAALLSLGRISEAVATAERLLERQSTSALRLAVQRAAGLNYLNRFAESQAQLDDVESRSPDPTTLSLVHSVRAQLALSSGSTTTLQIALDAAYAVDGLPEGARLSALTNDATHSVLACELARARSALTQARALADSLGAVAFDADLELTALMLDWRCGNWADLAHRIQRSVAELTGRGQRTNLAMLEAMRLELLTASGQLGEASEVDARLGGRDAVGWSFVAWAQAGYRIARGRWDEASEIIRVAMSFDRDHGRVSSAALLLSRWTEVDLLRGKVSDAAAHAAELTSLVDDLPLTRSRTFALRARGTAAADVTVLREAAEVAVADGMPVEAALARLAAGRLSKDAEVDLLPALSGFADAGAEAWRRQVAAELRGLGVPVPRASSRKPSRSGLTDGELRLSQLVQDGLSNKQIAAAMMLSPKTIEVYLSRIFSKIGVRSRVELAVAVSEGRLAENS